MAIFYGIDAVGLNRITLSATITIKDNNSGFLTINNNVIVADINGFNVFDKKQNPSGVNYVIIYSNNKYHLYTWQNSSNSTTLWLITEIQNNQSGTLQNTWKVLSDIDVKNIIGVRTNPQNWDEICYGDASSVCLSFAKSALQYGRTSKTLIDLNNNNNLGFGKKTAAKGDNSFVINGAKYTIQLSNSHLSC